MKRLAVIMSIYKGDVYEYVKLAVESILNQSYFDFDFYIQYDGYISPKIDTYLTNTQDNRILLYRRSENKGLAESLNELLSLILPNKYEYVARMDADDISMPERFEKQISYMDTHPHIDCLGTWATEILADGSFFYNKRMPINHDECLHFFMKRDCMIHPTVIFRSVYFEKAGLYPTNTYYGEDTMMWALGFSEGCKFANLPDYLYKFRLNDDFFNRRRGWKHAKSILNLRWKVNKMLHFPIKAYFYAIIYAIAKVMPKQLLQIVYKKAR